MKRTLACLLLAVPGLAWAQVPGLDGTSVVIYMVPGIVDAPGQNGTRFVSDVAVTNPGNDPAIIAVGFLPASGFPMQVVPLQGGQTVVWKNVLQQLWGNSGSGALQVIATSGPVLIRARTYNTAAGGTYGVALPVYQTDDFLLAGQRGHSLWVSQSADAARGYRTNVALLFPDSGGGTATVRIYDGNGDQTGQTDFSLDTAGVQQIGLSKFSSPVDVGRAEIEVTRGVAAGYAVVVDNVTGDSSLFAFQTLPAGIQDVLVNGVARANGKNGTFFRTDGRFFNPGASDARVTVAFHANGSSNPSPATGSVRVPAGKILDVTDVLGTLLGLPVGSSGALRFQSDTAVGVLCRTSNVDPTGAKPGTFGAQQMPVPLMSFLSSADAGALVSAIRQNTAYRTNLGFAAGADGATYQLTLKSAQGETVASATRSLGSFGWEQPGIDRIFSSIPDDAQLFVKVTQGSVDVYDSSVDNGSGDAVVTPAQQLPVAIPSSATIGPDGGSVRSDDGLLTLKIPAGALTGPAAVSIAPASGLALPGTADTAWLIQPEGIAFSRDALLVQTYAPADLFGGVPESLSLALSDGTDWYVLPGGSLDGFRRTLTVPLERIGARVLAREPLAGGAGVPATKFFLEGISPMARIAVEGSGASLEFTHFTIAAEPSSRTRKGRPAAKAGAPYPTIARWYEDGREVEFASVHKYRVPDCAPGKPVEIRTDDGLGNVCTSVVTVYPRNWTIQIDQHVSIDACQSLATPNVPIFLSGTLLTRSFTLGDDLKFRMTPDVHITNALNPDKPTLCPYLGPECHYTAIAIGKIEPGDIQSIANGKANRWDLWLNLKVQYTGMPLPWFEWSGSSCLETRNEYSEAFPPYPRTDEWRLFPDGYHPRAAAGPFAIMKDVISTQVFSVSISPASSPSCPR